MSAQPSPPSFKSLLGFVLVVVVVIGLIYKGFGGQYSRASFESRFNFHKPPPPGASTAVDLTPFLEPTPPLLAAGKQVFQANCVPCHGPEGMGNGERAAGLNPPPRNFHQPPGAAPFRFGTSVLTMYHTVTNGSPGTSMPSFIALSPEQRMAVVQYVRQWIPKDKLQPNSAADLAALNAAASAGPAALPALQPVPNGARIPIDEAMRIVAEEAQAAPAGGMAGARAGATPDLAAGGALYRTNCQSCHGGNGEGGIPVMMVESDPYVEVTAASFAQPRMLRSLGDSGGFEKIVLHGLPGRMMPGFGNLTRSQMDSLYAYVRQLSAAPEAAAGTPGGKR